MVCDRCFFCGTVHTRVWLSFSCFHPSCKQSKGVAPCIATPWNQFGACVITSSFVLRCTLHLSRSHSKVRQSSRLSPRTHTHTHTHIPSFWVLQELGSILSQKQDASAKLLTTKRDLAFMALEAAADQARSMRQSIEGYEGYRHDAVGIGHSGRPQAHTHATGSVTGTGTTTAAGGVGVHGGKGGIGTGSGASSLNMSESLVVLMTPPDLSPSSFGAGIRSRHASNSVGGTSSGTPSSGLLLRAAPSGGTGGGGGSSGAHSTTAASLGGTNNLPVDVDIATQLRDAEQLMAALGIASS